jgi:hypothetical protein
LLVLKLNAFAGRQQPKDAYDILLAVSRSVDGPEAAIASFQAEASAGNRGFQRASDTLRRHFLEPGQSGPLRCAAFVLDGQSPQEDLEIRRRQIVERMVTVAQVLAATV